MPNPTVRISERSHRTLKELAARSGQPMQDILDAAIEVERRRRFIEEANASYAKLRQDPQDWKELQAERAEWDATLMDGMDPDETWSESLPTGKRTRKSK